MFILQLTIALRKARAPFELFITINEPLVLLNRSRESHRLQLFRRLVCRGERKRRREGRIGEREAAGGDEPALRPKGLGEGEVARVAVDGPWREADRGPGREVAIREQANEGGREGRGDERTVIW